MDKPVSIEIVKQVAKGLDPILDKFVFVGGAVVELYANDPAASEIRPTMDIDVVVELTGYSAYADLQEQLSKLGFIPDSESSVICRYKFKDIKVDVMPTDENILGFSNQWYKKGLNHTVEYKLDEKTEIKIFKPPYFLATKFEAFKGRGGDYRTSHDFEDIVYFFDNRKGWVEEITDSEEDVKTYLKKEISKLIEESSPKESIAAHLPSVNRKERMGRIIDGLNQIINIED